MEKGNESVRERLLSRLPQPGDVAGYRKEIEAQLKKKSESLSTYRWTSWVLLGCWLVLCFMTGRVDSKAAVGLGTLAAMLLAVILVDAVRLEIRKAQFETFKEVKQVQVQILELRTSIEDDRQSTNSET
jgi:membrane protein insertase Oxa1/YidC/SpoIIIJ